MDRDLEVHRLTARLRTLASLRPRPVPGHIVSAGNPEPVYVGQLRPHRQLGASPAAGQLASRRLQPFFGATHANPMGLASRRRYRWARGRISDYWDEVFTAAGLETRAALDQSAFIASLGSSRSPRMRDVLGTIQTGAGRHHPRGIPRRSRCRRRSGYGQDRRRPAPLRLPAVLRPAPWSPPGRRAVRRPAPALYLAYVADVLPSLGEEGVQTATLRDLVIEGAAAVEADPGVARLKSSAANLVKAIETAVRFYEKPPAEGMTVETPWSGLWLSADGCGRGVRSSRTRYSAQRSARPDLGGTAHDPGGFPRRRRPG